MAEKQICDNCGQPDTEHMAVNLADGAFVSQTVFICPNAVFRLQPPVKRKKEHKVNG